MAYPRFQRSRDFKRALRTAGNVTINSSSAMNFDTALDLTLMAEAGDVIEYGISGRADMQNGADATFTVATMVSGSPVNNFHGATLAAGNGVGGWYVPNRNGTSGVQGMVMTGCFLYPLVSGDISSGTVTLRLRAIGAGTLNVLVYANSNCPFLVYAKNLGPADPN